MCILNEDGIGYFTLNFFDIVFAKRFIYLGNMHIKTSEGLNYKR
jgi:hypothetical protein